MSRIGLCLSLLFSLLGFCPAYAACNANNHFAEDLAEWLGSNPDVVSTTRARLAKINDNLGLLDNIVADYKAFFQEQQRAAPIGEIDLCNTSASVLLEQLETAVKKFP